MPIMDGEETIKSIRAAKPSTAQHYCIALTASNFQDQKERLLKLGFDAFLSKPLSLKQLADALNDVPRTLWVDPSADGAFMQNQNIVDAAKQNSFDFTFLKTQFGDAHKAIFKEIAPTFLKHAYQEVIDLRTFADAGNSEKVKRTSHSIKGAASSIGLTHLANALMQIENKPNSTNPDSQISAVEQIMRELKPLILQELDAID